MLLLEWHFFDGDGVTGEKMMVNMKMANIVGSEVFIRYLEYEYSLVYKNELIDYESQ